MLTNQLSLFSSLDNEPINGNILYSPIADNANIEAFLNDWQQSKYFGLDLETYGLKENDGLRQWRGSIRLIQIALPSGQTGVFDLGGWADEVFSINLKLKGVLHTLKQTCRSKEIIKVGHNLKFDLRWLYEKYGIEARNVRDTMLLSQLLWAGLKSYRHSLKDVASRALGVEVDKTEQKSDFGWDLTNKQINYAAKDAQLVLPLFKELGRLIKEADLLAQAQIECAAIPIFVEMETKGFSVDFELLESTIAQYEKAQQELSQPFKDTFPSTQLTASSQELANLFNKKLQIDLSTTEDAVLQGYRHIPEIKSLILFRTLKKSLDYLYNMRTNYREGSCRGSYRQLAPTGFGRTTCGSAVKKSAIDGINLQNCPKPASDPEIKELNLTPIRACFKPREGRSLLIADLSQAHLRIATEASQDPVLLAAYNDGVDMHLMTALGLARQRGYKWDYNECSAIYSDKKHPDYKTVKELRDISKAVMYGSLNSQGKNALLTSAAKGNVPMSEQDAEDGLKAWRVTYSRLYGFQFDIVRKTNEKNLTFPGIDGEFGEVRGLSGRRIFMIKKPDFNGNPSVYKPDTCAFYWAGVESDIIKKAMVLFQESVDMNPKWGAFIANVVHDEIVVDCDDEYKLEVATVLFQSMNTSMEIWVKTIPVDDFNNQPSKLICDSWNDK